MSADDSPNIGTPRSSRYAHSSSELSRVGGAIQQRTHDLEARYRELQTIMHITARVNEGLFLDDILDGVYQDFKMLIPYERIGFSLIEEKGTVVRARWAQAEYTPLLLDRGYAAKLEGSTLEQILLTGQPRIINDLEAYFAHKPNSASTRLILDEGIRSSLTCPLIANGEAVGFMFFSSRTPHTYADAHVEVFQQIAGQLSVMVEKGQLVAELSAQKLELEHKNDELSDLNKLKNSFLGIAAHDLRNPLSNILMATSLMTSPDFDLTEEDRRTMLREIDNQAQYMMNLLNDLLDVSHIESGSFTLLPVEIDLPSFLREVAIRHHRLAEAKNSAVQLDNLAPGRVFADPIRLAQVLDNLISNAVKYSPPGSTITVRTRAEKRMWRVEVQDQGPGLTIEDQALLFKDFVRLSATPTNGEKSTGLGLAIARRVVEAQGGTIGVESEFGHGATFWFTVKNARRDRSR